MRIQNVTVLCADKNSAYKTISGLDVWDRDRDAYYFTGSNRIIAHPPCAQWSKLRAWANVDADSKELAMHCLKHVLRNGGVIEHPVGSLFFKEMQLPAVQVNQVNWGFPCTKKTLLFFHKCTPLPIPPDRDPTHCIAPDRASKKYLPTLPKRLRAHTTPEFATWLINSVLS